ncbi:head GIN domain-containing protein [Paraflavitalea pollutisoli]|uniref:head GIN domain-containing protein n=1 Tax=Paraflavitalea pollutisoli TaxID=3034143 RepID=UPI0023EDAA0A|nr:head GIN domain-containing protein [Paraflavitalea sp. H1-2-19X]
MKKIGLLGVSILFSLVLFAQKQINDPLAQVRKVSGFHSIKVSNGIKVYLTQGAEAVAVSASKEEYRDKIVTRVENGVLKIYYDQETLKFWKYKNMKGVNPVAYVSIDKVDGLDIASGASVVTDGTIKGDKLDLDVSSGGTFRGAVTFDGVSVDQSSGAVVNISGTANSLSVDGSSGSAFHGFELVVNNCSADVSSGASIQITMNKEMSAEASSGGSVTYKGNGVIRNVKTGSGGAVRKG